LKIFFDDILKKVLGRGILEYCKWHPGCRSIPTGNHWGRDEQTVMSVWTAL